MNKKIGKRSRGDVRIGGNVRSPEAKLGIGLGIGLAVVSLFLFHSATVMGSIAVVLVILWFILPKKGS